MYTHCNTTSNGLAKYTVAVSECSDLMRPDLDRIDGSNHQDRLGKEERVNEHHGSSSSAVLSAYIVSMKLTQA